MNWLLTLSTWIHVTSAVILVGGAFFFRVYLLKYAAREGGLSDDLRNAITKRWLHGAFAFLLVLLATGFYNMSQKNALWKASETGLSPHMVFGIKFLVFCVVFALTIGGSVIKDHAKKKLFLTVNVVLGLVIVLLSAILSNSY